MDHDKGLDVLLVVHGEAAGRRRTAGGTSGIPGDPRRKAADLILDLLFCLIAALGDFLLQRYFKFITICVDFTPNSFANLRFESSN